MAENTHMNIFEKIEVLRNLKVKFKTKIKFYYVFEDNNNEKSIFLVTNDDDVYCQGSNSKGILGFLDPNFVEVEKINDELSNKNIIQFDNTSYNVVARTQDGKIYSWGWNKFGVLGNGIKDTKRYKPELNLYLSNEKISIKDIRCGDKHTVVLTDYGDIYAWGCNYEGQVGNNCSDECVVMPVKINGLDGVKCKSISCGSHHSMVLTENGRVLSWGRNDSGQLGINETENINSPKQVVLDEKIIIKSISCGSEHSLLLTRDEYIYVFGFKKYKHLGIDTSVPKLIQTIPMKLSETNKFTRIFSHRKYRFSAALSEDGLYYIWDQMMSQPKEINCEYIEDTLAQSFVQLELPPKQSKKSIAHKSYAESHIDTTYATWRYEATSNREEYLKNFARFLDQVEVNEEFWDLLREHEYFSHHLKNIDWLKTDESRKVYIFLELTKETIYCEAIIKILKESRNFKAAEMLEMYKIYPVININSFDIEIPVLRTKIPKVGHNMYKMLRNPRGLFIIINNVKNGLWRESERFKHIFSELLFEVELWFNLNVKQIEERLKKISKLNRLEEDEALGVMIISNGIDEKVIGFDACEEFTKPKIDQEIKSNDQIKFSDLVQIFSKENCKPLANKPKIFIFDCSRKKEFDKSSVSITSMITKNEQNIQLSESNECEYTVMDGELVENEKLKLKFKYADQNWVNENTHTFIIYSCSEGYDSWFLNEITVFGQVFSHAIARFACVESLQSIMCRTCSLMEQSKEMNVFSAPEFRQQCTERELYFNPRHYETEIKQKF